MDDVCYACGRYGTQRNDHERWRRIAKHLSIGLLARTYPQERIRDILVRMGLQSKRVRDLPAEALVYYVIALGLFMAVSTGEVLRSLVEGLQWLGGASTKLKVTGKAAISQARPIALEGQPGAFYRGLRLVFIDGSTRDVADTKANLAHFGRQESSRGQSAFPQLRFVAHLSQRERQTRKAQRHRCAGVRLPDPKGSLSHQKTHSKGNPPKIN